MTEPADPAGKVRSGFWAAVDPRNPLSRIYALMLLFTMGEGGLRFLVPVYLDSQGASFVAVGTVTSAFAVATLVARVPAGALYRPERARWLVLAAGTASSVSFVLVAFVSRVDIITVLMIIDGIGWGTVTTLLLTLMLSSRSANVSASSAMGWYIGVTGAGHALAGITAGVLADTLGLRPAFLVLAMLPLVATAVISWRMPRPSAPTTVAAGPSETWRRRWAGVLRGIPLPVWIAGVAALYLNAMSSILNTFFPILALTLGLSLSQAGGLASIRSGVSAIARFVSIPVFERVASERLRFPLLAISAVTTAVVPLTGVFLLQVPLWVLNGASRGFIRVGTGVDAMESLSDGQEGIAAAVMSSGLDLGKVVGPLLAGVVADQIGTAGAFYTVPAAFFGLYLMLEAARLVRRRRPRDPEPMTEEPTWTR